MQAVKRCYVRDFGEVKLAVMESQVGPRQIRTVTEVVYAAPTPQLWKRLAGVLQQAEAWVEAQ